MLLSIVIPVYNLEKYIERTLKSVLDQCNNDKNIEVIIVDDGSSDNSGILINKFTNNLNVKIIHQLNGGVSAARNTGINQSSGDYIFFVDGDDTLYNGTIDKIMDILNKNRGIDVIFGNIMNVKQGKKELDIEYNKRILGFHEGDFLETIKYLIKSKKYFSWNSCQYIYSREVIGTTRYPLGVISGEDCIFFSHMIEKLNRAYITNFPFVEYEKDRLDSITNKQSDNAVIDQLKVFNQVYYYFNDDILKSFFANRFTNIIPLIPDMLSPDNKDIAYKLVRNNMIVLKNTRGVKYSVTYILLNLFGIERGSNYVLKINRWRRKNAINS